MQRPSHILCPGAVPSSSYYSLRCAREHIPASSLAANDVGGDGYSARCPRVRSCPVWAPNGVVMLACIRRPDGPSKFLASASTELGADFASLVHESSKGDMRPFDNSGGPRSQLRNISPVDQKFLEKQAPYIPDDEACGQLVADAPCTILTNREHSV